MTDEMKLLRAFIEASGFDITETTIEVDWIPAADLNGIPNFHGKVIGTTTVIDYKVTKKVVRITF